MNSEQRRKARRAFDKKYPYRINVLGKKYPEAYDWCSNNLKKSMFIPKRHSTDFSHVVRLSDTSYDFYFRKSEDAVMFSLIVL